MQEPHSDDDDSEDEEDNDMDSDGEQPAHAHLPPHHQRRVSLSDGSESDTSPPPSRKDTSALLKSTNSQILEVKSPIRQNKQDKSKNLDCDKAYLDELVELHKRLMTLREGHILQQVSVCGVTVQRITTLEENCRLMLYCWMKMKLK
uniref:Uncharacterized protein n=1 Tax=Oryzias sinensis TaxID=183150 RepID=A0A8C7WV09_9TELE